MAKQVLSFALNPTQMPICELQLPAGAHILYAREQGDSICVFALTEPGQEKERRKFLAVMSNRDLPATPGHTPQYIGSAHFENGSLVYHVFVLKP